MTGVMISLRAEEKSALLRLAEREHRDPRSQAALIIRQELERQGLLSGQSALDQINTLMEKLSSEVKEYGPTN